MKKLIITLLFILYNPIVLASTGNTGVDWQKWDNNLFKTATKADRYVILDLEAVWCHWCHVMEQKTYADPGVQQVLRDSYISVRVDQDSRPDLASRYREYGWPATIIFAPDGSEIVKRAGYIAPDNMLRLLKAVIADPSPESASQLALPSRFAEQGLLSDPLKKQLRMNHNQAIDHKIGGLKTGQKYIDRDSVEYAIYLAGKNNNTQEQWAKKTLDQALNLFDKSWGGVYQYSTHGDWQHQHYEKIMSVQASYLRLYAFAWAKWKKPEYRTATRDIIRYLDQFLTSPQGAFYTSQDADVIQGQHSEDYFSLDDPARRKIGMPRIDKNIYARENGWMIEALAYLFEVTGEKQYLQRAYKAASWIIQHHSLENGGYSHGRQDNSGPYLGDNLAMARALLQLYRASGDRHWLKKSMETAHFIRQHFQYEAGGFTPVIQENQAITPVPQIDENISATRFFNLLYHYTGQSSFKTLSEHGMRFLATPAIATSRLTEAGILLADIESGHDPMHITVIGGKQDEDAQSLYLAAMHIPALYKRLEWWDTREGKLINPDINYPVLDKTAAFVCHDGRCSLPLFSREDIQGMF